MDQIYLTGSRMIIKREVFENSGKHFTLWFGNDIEVIKLDDGKWISTLPY